MCVHVAAHTVPSESFSPLSGSTDLKWNESVNEMEINL